MENYHASSSTAYLHIQFILNLSTHPVLSFTMLLIGSKSFYLALFTLGLLHCSRAEKLPIVDLDYASIRPCSLIQQTNSTRNSTKHYHTTTTQIPSFFQTFDMRKIQLGTFDFEPQSLRWSTATQFKVAASRVSVLKLCRPGWRKRLFLFTNSLQDCLSTSVHGKTQYQHRIRSTQPFSTPMHLKTAFSLMSTSQDAFWNR